MVWAGEELSLKGVQKLKKKKRNAETLDIDQAHGKFIRLEKPQKRSSSKTGEDWFHCFE